MAFSEYHYCVENLKENFYNTDFINEHTRPELAHILQLLYPHMTKQNQRSFTTMCKDRACKHIEAWLMIHSVICEK